MAQNNFSRRLPNTLYIKLPGGSYKRSLVIFDYTIFSKFYILSEPCFLGSYLNRFIKCKLPRNRALLRGRFSSRLPTALFTKLPGGAYKVKTSYNDNATFSVCMIPYTYFNAETHFTSPVSGVLDHILLCFVVVYDRHVGQMSLYYVCCCCNVQTLTQAHSHTRSHFFHIHFLSHLFPLATCASFSGLGVACMQSLDCWLLLDYALYY